MVFACDSCNSWYLNLLNQVKLELAKPAEERSSSTLNVLAAAIAKLEAESCGHPARLI